MCETWEIGSLWPAKSERGTRGEVIDVPGRPWLSLEMGWAMRQSSSPLAVGTCLVNKEKRTW